MTWLTRRQLRVPAAGVYALLAAVGVVLLLAGRPSLVSGLTLSPSDHALYIAASSPWTPPPPSSACSGARRWSPGSWRPARTGWPGTSPSPGAGGWP